MKAVQIEPERIWRKQERTRGTDGFTVCRSERRIDSESEDSDCNEVMCKS